MEFKFVRKEKKSKEKRRLEAYSTTADSKSEEIASFLALISGW